MKPIDEQISSIKDKLPEITPPAPSFKAQASVHDLKGRLDWGEPGLTIIDARDRDSFNKSHITGAMAMPMDEDLVARAKSSLEFKRDIYVYGSSDEETARAAAVLREAGFRNVAEIEGGITAWKAIQGPIDGSMEHANPGPDAYNVVNRLQRHAETQKIYK